MPNILVQQTDDGADLEIFEGQLAAGGGLETAAYLALFGGNEADAGGADETFMWWGSIDETDPAYRYRSETQNLLQSIPAIPANLRRIEDAVERDLAFMVTAGAVSSVVAAASMPARNRVHVSVEFKSPTGSETFNFLANWEASL